ncbi:MAG TPA: sulfatase, partial [Verrucomicrobiae bacterium]|nr:sulfatase [Verrucomicrobiae bacterium]
MNANFRFANARALTRRHFFARAGLSLGGIALGSLIARDGSAAARSVKSVAATPLAIKPPTFAARAKAIIYMHMAGAPPSLDLFDYKPKLNELNMQPCPESLFKGVR